MPVTGKRRINHINKLTGCLKEKKCFLTLCLVLWSATVQFKQSKLLECVSVCVCVCVYQVEGCLEMTELQMCLWLWSAYGKHSKSEGNQKYPPSDTNKFNKR